MRQISIKELSVEVLGAFDQRGVAACLCLSERSVLFEEADGKGVPHSAEVGPRQSSSEIESSVKCLW